MSDDNKKKEKEKSDALIFRVLQIQRTGQDPAKKEELNDTPPNKKRNPRNPSKL